MTSAATHRDSSLELYRIIVMLRFWLRLGQNCQAWVK